MMLKRALCAIMAMVMLFALTACKSGGNSDKLVIKLNGVIISAPLTVEKLGSDYSVDKSGFAIMYKGEVVAGVIFDENSSESDHSKKKITRLLSIANGGTKSVSVNGIVTGSAQSEVLNAVGEPWKKEETLDMWVYHEDGKPENENYLLISFDKDNRVSQIIVDPSK